MKISFALRATLGLVVMTSIVPAFPALSAPQQKAQGQKVAHQVYDSYFESNKSGLKGSNSLLTFDNQNTFDWVFGSAATMGQNAFLPADVFKSKLVVAVIKRGSDIWSYKVNGTEARKNTLYLNYTATPKSGAGASFSSPLIVAVDKKPYQKFVFIENGKSVGSVELAKPAAAMRKVKVYLVAVGDAGKMGRKFGCDDSLVPTTRTVPATGSPLTSALRELISTPRTYAPNSKLSNFWQGPGLQLKSVSVKNGVATIRFSGAVAVAGICDEPRIIEQVEATAKQFPTVKRVKVFVGNQNLADAIS